MAFNTLQPGKYNIFIYHRLTVMQLWKRGLPQNICTFFTVPLLAFFLTIYVFGSCFRKLAVILVSDFLGVLWLFLKEIIMWMYFIVTHSALFQISFLKEICESEFCFTWSLRKKAVHSSTGTHVKKFFSLESVIAQPFCQLQHRL